MNITKKMKKSHIQIIKGLFFSVLIPASTIMSGQVFSPDYFNVTGSDGLMSNAWAGGMTAPQFSEIDLNGDAYMDLYHFDKDGAVHVFYLNDGNVGEVSYTYAPEYIKNFPICEGWVNLKDFNGDGLVDLFTFDTNGISGIRVYKGALNSEGELYFIPYVNPVSETSYLVFKQTPNSSALNIYSTVEDFPAFIDVDKDGDLDILNFGSGGTYVRWYRNISTNPEDLIFLLGDYCWGGFGEGSLSQEVFMNLEDSLNCVDFFVDNEDPSQHVIHPGSTLCVFDEDGDEDYDILLGDVTNKNLVFLRNNDGIENAWMTEDDITYPSYDVPIFISEFPLAFYQDFDNDGSKDLMATNFNDNGIENYNMTWFYKNMGSDSAPLFELQSVNSLTKDMMDFGSLSSPAFFDYNGDGLMDILIGTGGYKVDQGYEPSLILLENIGSATDPSFSIVDYDYLNLSTFTGEKNFAPCFGDLDNDQDEDLLIGLSDGYLIYFENEGGAGNSFLFGSPQVQWKGLDIGQNCSPFIIDLDRDGDQDLVIGERSGNLNFIKNIGSPESFECDIDLASPNINTNLGGVDATEVSGGVVGNSSPLFLEIEDHYELILGTQSGRFFRYTDVDQNLDQGSVFTLVNDSMDIVHTGSHVSMALADLNDSGELECVVGNNRGGLSLYGSDLAKEYIFLDQKEVKQNEILATIYPNPVKNQVYISLDNKHNLENVKIYDASGQLVLVSSDSNVDCTSLKAGIYLLKVSSTNGFKGFNRFVKQ